MNDTAHYLDTQIDQVGNNYCLCIQAKGKITGEDYSGLRKEIEQAIADTTAPRLHILFDVTAMTGWELRAAWDDTLLAFQQAKYLDRVAIVGQRDWQEIMASAADWFVPGKVKYFTDRNTARDWLSAC